MTTQAQPETPFDWKAHFAANPSPIQRRAQEMGVSAMEAVHSRAAEIYEADGDTVNAAAARRACEAAKSARRPGTTR